MKIKRDEMEIELTSKELREAFLEQQKIYQIEDAETHLRNYLDFYESDALTLLIHRMRYGVEYPDFFDKNSNDYILDQIVEDYNARCDCNIAENDSYEDVIGHLMRQLKADNEDYGFISLADDSFLPRMELWKTEEYYLDLDFVDPEGSDYIDFYIPITFDICEALNIPDNDDDLISMYVDYFPTSKKVGMTICYQSFSEDYSFEVKLSKEQQEIIIKTLNEQAKKVYGDDMDGLYRHEKEEAEKLG